MYLVSHLAAPQLGVVLLGDAGEVAAAAVSWCCCACVGWWRDRMSKGYDCSGKVCLLTASAKSVPTPSPAVRPALNPLDRTGHSVTPQMGEGCNSALEDCAMLAQAQEGAGYDVRAGLAAFEVRRAPQV